MTLRQLPEARQALRGRAFFRCRGAAEAVLTFEPEVMPVNPNKKCGIRIFMLFQPSMMIFIFAGVSSLVQIWPDSLNKKCGIRIFYLFRRKE